MAKKEKPTENHNEESAFELIEMAINDIDVLTKAFHMVTKICDGMDDTAEEEDEPSLSGIPENLLN